VPCSRPSCLWKSSSPYNLRLELSFAGYLFLALATNSFAIALAGSCLAFFEDFSISASKSAVSQSQYICKSASSDQIGFLNAAGLVPSNAKCPRQTYGIEISFALLMICPAWPGQAFAVEMAVRPLSGVLPSPTK
jgi:hypothetical protein